MADPVHIKNGVLTVDTQEVRFRGGTFTDRTRGVTITDSGSGGAREYLAGGGIEEFDLNFPAYWRPDATFLGVTGTPGTPPRLRKGRLVPFTLELVTGIVYAGTIYIEECEMALGEIDGDAAVLYNVTSHGSGPLTYPAPVAPGP
jgi:hypothetical protein